MEKQLVVGRTYAVTTSTTCDVTDANGTLITSAASGQQVVFVAPTTTVSFSDDSASVVAVFKLAPAKLWALGVFGRGETLPSGYLPALFLESTGTQYIDTGIKLSNESEVWCKGSWVKQHNVIAFVYGARQSIRVKSFAFLASDSGGYSGFQYNDQIFSIDSIDGDFEVKQSGNLCFLNGNLRKTFQEADFETPVSSFLFHVNEQSTSVYKLCVCKIYSFSIARAGTEQANYIPAIDAQGVPCMWDKVTKQPFYNSGSGSFIVGMTAKQARKLGNLPDGGGTLTISLPSTVVDENGVLQDMAIFTALSQAAAKGWSFILQTHDGTAVETAVPAGYMECEFLESTGTQYLDTGVGFESFGSAEHDMQFTPVVKRDNYTGFLSGSDFIGVTGLAFGIGGEKIWYANVGTYENDAIYDRNVWQLVVENGERSALFVNSELIASKSLPTTIDPITFCLFSGVSRNTFASARCHSLLVYDRADSEQANYTPAITPAGVPCMWDSVTAQPFTNDGSGAFIVGMTAAQAVQLANLPSGGGALTVSLPQSILNDEGEITDAAVRAALNKAADNGWTITLQYYTEQ